MSSQETQTQQQENGPAGYGHPAQQQALAPRRNVEAGLRVDAGGVLRPSSLEEAMRLAKLLSDTDFVPKDYREKPGSVLAAVMMGSELGLAPLQAIQNIAVINGRPSVWGDAMLAICRAHPEWGGIQETGDEKQAKCVVTRLERIGGKVVVQTYVGEFTIEEAQRAKLLEKETPWKGYPKRMLKFRARGYALRDAFADALKGIHSAEESQDIIDVEAHDVPRAAAAPTAAPEVSAQPKKGADALRERLGGKTSDKAPEAQPAQASAAAPAAQTATAPQWKAEVQEFIDAIAKAKTYDELDAIGADLDQAKASFSPDEQAAIATAGKSAWESLRKEGRR